MCYIIDMDNTLDADQTSDFILSVAHQKEDLIER